jgi:hypothetical protein
VLHNFKKKLHHSHILEGVEGSEQRAWGKESSEFRVQNSKFQGQRAEYEGQRAWGKGQKVGIPFSSSAGKSDK